MIPTYRKPYEGLFKFHKLIPFSLRKSSIHSPFAANLMFNSTKSCSSQMCLSCWNLNQRKLSEKLCCSHLWFCNHKNFNGHFSGFWQTKNHTTWYGVISYKYYPLVTSVQSWGSLVPMFPWCSWCWEMSSKFNINNLTKITIMITTTMISPWRPYDAALTSTDPEPHEASSARLPDGIFKTFFILPYCNLSVLFPFGQSIHCKFHKYEPTLICSE